MNRIAPILIPLALLSACTTNADASPNAPNPPRPAIATIEASPNVLEPEIDGEASFAKNYFPSSEETCPRYFPLPKLAGRTYKLAISTEESTSPLIVLQHYRMESTLKGEIYLVENEVNGVVYTTKRFFCDEGDAVEIVVRDGQEQHRLFMTGRQPFEPGFNIMPLCAIVKVYPIFELNGHPHQDVIEVWCYEGDKFWFSPMHGLVRWESPLGINAEFLAEAEHSPER